MKNYVPAILVLMANPAFSEDTRQLDAHEHGVGELNIAIDGDAVAMEFHAPGADIVGFEHQATSAEDRAAIDEAVAILAKPLDLFVLPAAAECSVVQASTALASEDAHDDHEHGHEEHAEAEEHDGHDHEEHAKVDAHSDHEHEDHAEAEASHTEFRADYVLACGNPGALTGIEFAYFETFKNARELEVQIVSASGAQAFEVERDDPSLDLRGMF